MAKGKKTGGRKAGTPNTVGSDLRKILAQRSLDYFKPGGMFDEDMLELEPKDRVAAMNAIRKASVPDMQTATIDIAVDSSDNIIDRLKKLI